MTLRTLFLGALGALALPLALAGCGPADTGGDMTVLTVTGAIGAPDREALNPDTDRYFAWAGFDFDDGRNFSRRELAGLPRHQIHINTDVAPAGAYEGPLLADVLDLAGADWTRDAVYAHALDGYASAIPLGPARQDGAILALTRNGEPLPLGGEGPLYVVFPEDAGADPGWYVWGLVLLSVE